MPSILGKKFSQKDYDRITSADKKHDIAKKAGLNVAAKDYVSQIPSTNAAQGREVDLSRINRESGTGTAPRVVPVNEVRPSLPLGFDGDPEIQEMAINEGQEERLRNVVDVVKNSFDFDRDTRVVANTESKLLNKGLETAANSPYATAGVIAGGFSSVKGFFRFLKKLTKTGGSGNIPQVGKLSQESLKAISSAGMYARTASVTTRSAAITAKLFKRMGLGAAGISLAVASLGSYPWAGHLNVDNALGSYRIAARDANNAGLVDEAQEMEDAVEEFVNPDFWERFQRSVPIWNVVHAAQNVARSAALTNEVYDKIFADQQNNPEESWSDSYLRNMQEKRDLELRWREEDEAYYSAIAEEKNRAAMEEREAEAAMWDKILAERDAREKEKREYWDEYWKKYSQAMTENKDELGYSKLGFGLL